MKKLFIIALFFTSFIMANDKIPELNSKLTKGQFTFTGKVTTNMDGHEFNIKFKGKTSSNSFICLWDDDLDAAKMLNWVKINKNNGTISLAKMKEQKGSAEMAIAASTGVSGGSSRLMYALWNGDKSAIFPNKDVKVVKKGSLTIISGYLVTQFLKITMKNDMIITIESEMDLEKVNLNKELVISDDEIKEALKFQNKEITAESIKEMRKILSDSKDSLSQFKGKMKTQINFNINF